VNDLGLDSLDHSGSGKCMHFVLLATKVKSELLIMLYNVTSVCADITDDHEI
jgi:hypothetical protein